MSVVTNIRWTVKEAVRSPNLSWAEPMARAGWYWFRSVTELARVPQFLLSFRKADRQQSPSRLIELAFNEYGGMFQPLQNRNEIRRFMIMVMALSPETVVEIGTARGGTLFLLSCVASQDATIVSVDLPGGIHGGGYPAWKGCLYDRMVGEGQCLTRIRGDSHSAETRELVVDALNGEKVDLLFIDGDHTIAGVKRDFELYKDLVRPGALIVLHDILENRWEPTVSVAPFWRELKEQYETTEIVDSYDQGQFGIGVVKMPGA